MSKPMESLVGKVFGKLTVLEMRPAYQQVTKALCMCECGQETLVRTDALKNGLTKSCGCGLAKAQKLFTQRAIRDALYHRAFQKGVKF